MYLVNGSPGYLLGCMKNMAILPQKWSVSRLTYKEGRRIIRGAAFNEFVAGNQRDNVAFFSAFSSAWVKATENGYDSLIGLLNICEETLEPTLNPTGICSDVNSFKDMKEKSEIALGWKTKISAVNLVTNAPSRVMPVEAKASRWPQESCVDRYIGVTFKNTFVI